MFILLKPGTVYETALSSVKINKQLRRWFYIEIAQFVRMALFGLENGEPAEVAQ